MEKVTATGLQKLDFDFLLRYGLIVKVPDLPVTLFHCPTQSLHSYAVATTGSPLHRLAHTDDAKAFRILMDLGYDINGLDAWGRTPLKIATENNCNELAHYMLEEGARLDPSPMDNTKGDNLTTNHLV